MLTSPVLKRYLTYASAFVAGALLPFAFAPFGWWPVALLSLAWLYFVVISVDSVWQRFFACLFWGLGKFWVGAYWIFVSLYSFADVGLSVSSGMFLVVVILCGLITAAICIARYIPEYPTASAAFCAIVVLGVELGLSRLWRLSFPWLHVGYAFIDTPIAYYATVGGVFLVSFLAIFTAFACVNLKDKSWYALAIAFVVWTGGFLLLPSEEQNGERIDVALVQGNVSLLDKWKEDSWQNRLARYRTLSRRGTNADLVVWPESAIPFDLNQSRQTILDSNRDLEGRLIFGAIESSLDGEGESSTYNVVAALAFGELQLFRKEKLVPFAEYIPLRSVLSGVLGSLGYPMSNLSPAPERQGSMRFGNVVLTPVICFEVAYPSLIRKRAEHSQLIVVLSEDTWLGDTTGPWQHLQIVRMRALELGLPLVRATNDGVTAHIDRQGKVVAQARQHRTEVLSTTVVLGKRDTLFARFGLTWLWLVIAVTIGYFYRLKQKGKLASKPL